MKKIIFLMLILIITSLPLIASADIQYAEVVEQNYLPTPYISGISLMSTEKTLEETLVTAWENLDAEIDVSKYNISKDEISQIYYPIVFNNPRLYYVVTGFGYYYNSQGDVVKIVPKYSTTNKVEIRTMLNGIDEETERILNTVNEGMSDFDKAMAVHDYIVLNYKYDTTYSIYNTSMMVTKTGVCQAYALIYKHILNLLDIPCTFVSSNNMNHAWNLVQIDGNWYHVDSTWDDPLTDRYAVVSHKYAFLSSNAIENLPNPHYDYDLSGFSADSTTYDNSSWRTSISPIISAHGKRYYIADRKLIEETTSSIIYDGFTNKYGGLAYYNDKIYFNTSQKIKSLDLSDNTISNVVNVPNIYSMFLSGNTIKYSKYINESIEYGGEYMFSKARIGESIIQNNKLTTKIYLEDGASVGIYVKNGDNDIDYLSISDSGCNIIEIPLNPDETSIAYFWDDNMVPYIKPIKVAN